MNIKIFFNIQKKIDNNFEISSTSGVLLDLFLWVDN